MTLGLGEKPTNKTQTKVAVNQLAAYSSPINFHNVDSYVPERWLPEVTNDATSPYYNDRRDVVQPFSVGPRNCIGRNLAYNEMRLILARVLWNFDLVLGEESKYWNNQRTYILWDKPSLLCKLKDRRATR
jgi:cytochrome P450